MPQTMYNTGATAGGVPTLTGAQQMPSASDVYQGNQQKQVAQIGANAAMYPATLQQQRFQQVFPYLQSQLNGGNPYAQGGTPGLGPNISAAPVLNSQQVQQQVNTQNAASDQSTAGQIKGYQNSAAGRGIGANSPLVQALSGQAQSANLAGKTANETQTRLGAAQQNSQQVLAGQTAQQGQYATQQQEEIARAAPYFQQQNILLQALAGLV